MDVLVIILPLLSLPNRNWGLEYVTVSSQGVQGCWVMAQNQIPQTIFYKCNIKLE